MKIGIGQRAIFIETEEGNVLWDCVPYIDDTFVEEVSSEFLSCCGVEYLLFCSCLITMSMFSTLDIESNEKQVKAKGGLKAIVVRSTL